MLKQHSMSAHIYIHFCVVLWKHSTFICINIELKATMDDFQLGDKVMQKTYLYKYVCICICLYIPWFWANYIMDLVENDINIGFQFSTIITDSERE